MEIVFELNSNGKRKVISFAVEMMEDLLHGFGDFQPAAITNCHIYLKEQGQTELDCNVEILGATPELVLKTGRFYFYERAWGYLKLLEPRFATVREYQLWDENDATYALFSKCCQIVTNCNIPEVKALEKIVDYLQSLEDSIRCGQVAFQDSLTDTNVNQARLATLIVAGLLPTIQTKAQIDAAEQLVQVVVPEFTTTAGNRKAELYEGLEQMIGYVNSVCD